ncbi:AAA family ATPase [Streptomyces sp. QHH-9511]|uniref:AAA family ATPase n=1 Tax=Streptomyces sp. QHH-9511 TaxID=2684468 RepID=UPI001319634A|nr:AAA family ATPase [Streptomyces sp. QHH-9511]QGZ52406.1 AAA family ATPase [Streptomyces sp. QHH-9511]
MRRGPGSAAPGPPPRERTAAESQAAGRPPDPHVLGIAVLVGLQASGKSTFYGQRLAGRYALISKDLFPRSARRKQERQMRLVETALAEGRSVAVDNTNPSPEEWRPLVAAGHAHGATATAYWFPPDVAGSKRRNAARQGRERVPDVGIQATFTKLRRPSLADGFDAVYEVRFDGRGGFLVRSDTGVRSAEESET